MRNRIIVSVVLGAVMVAGVFAFNNYNAPKTNSTTSALQAKAARAESVSAEGVVVPAQRAALAFKTGGRVVEILVHEGDAVKTGAALARVDDALLKAQVAQAEAAYAVAQAQLARLKAGASKEEVAVVSARAQEAATAHAQAQDSYDRLSWVGGPTEVQLRSAVDRAGAMHNTALMDVERVKAGARLEDIGIAQAQVDQAKAALELTRVLAQDALLLAPFDGTVAAINVDVGQVVTPVMPVIMFGNLAQLQIETVDLSEEDLVRVAVGQPAKITLDAFPDRTFRGQVARVSLVASDNRGDKVFKVTIELLESANTGLRWGMTVNVAIMAEPEK